MDFDEENYAEMEPEYDMEFVRYGPNPIELPLSPPGTPPPEEEHPGFVREPSPFSETSSMTSVDSTESVGTQPEFSTALVVFMHRMIHRLLPGRRRTHVPIHGKRQIISFSN